MKKKTHLHYPGNCRTDCLRDKTCTTLITRNINEVTCKSCQKTATFLAAKYFQEQEFGKIF